MGQSSYFNLSLLISAVLVGACAGFLPLNWHPAKMFMGDAGALLVGLLMATSAVAITGQIDPSALSANPADAGVVGRSQLLGAFIPIILPFAILIVPLLDFALAIVRRLRAGKSPFSADRLHLHHRLLDMGHSHLHAVLLFYAWTSVIALSCLMFFVFQPYWFALAFLVVGVIVCTVFTLAPLGRRKAVEMTAQSAEEGTPIAEDLASYDPLDEAAEARHPDVPISDAVTDKVLSADNTSKPEKDKR
jgi:UDP-GlcNAc:undecaprenyl-phosphate GlcNAc-1-phosphate transferase